MAYKTYTSGVVNATDNPVHIKANLGQGVKVKLKNINVTFCPVEVSANGDTEVITMHPWQEKTFQFTCFGEEPIFWDISINATSDNPCVAYTILSNYI